jgi:hypothetical protein
MIAYVHGLKDLLFCQYQSDPPTSYNPDHNSGQQGFFCRNWKPDPKLDMEIQGIQRSQNILEKEEPSWLTHTSQLWSLLQSYSVGGSIRDTPME